MIDVAFRQCWEILIWLDIANFGGVKGKLTEDLQNESQGSQTDDVRDNESTEEDCDEEKEVSSIFYISSHLLSTYIYF